MENTENMHSFDLRAPAGANKKKRIVGRGQGSGRGTTAGRGSKGQKSRSGGKVYLGHEGGQMPLYRRLAHRGFSNYPFKETNRIVSLAQLEKNFEDGEVVSIPALFEKKLIKGAKAVKILSDGALTKRLDVQIPKVSLAAKEKIKKAGGTVAEFEPLAPRSKGKKDKAKAKKEVSE